MIPDSHAKSFLSQSYVNAVVTQAGYACQFSNPDYGTDARVSEIQVLPNGKFLNSGFDFDIQIKASHNCKITSTEVIYSLDGDAYDRLINYKGGFVVLVVFFVPEKADERIELRENALELRNCCYWYRVTENDKKTIHIPRSQIFNPVACKSLMEYAIKREWQK